MTPDYSSTGWKTVFFTCFHRSVHKVKLEIKVLTGSLGWHKHHTGCVQHEKSTRITFRKVTLGISDVAITRISHRPQPVYTRDYSWTGESHCYVVHTGNKTTGSLGWHKHTQDVFTWTRITFRKTFRNAIQNVIGIVIWTRSHGLQTPFQSRWPMRLCIDPWLQRAFLKCTRTNHVPKQLCVHMV